nr:macrophage mannose receptor 1-like [Misgurnus anguillicaudatus]
MFPLIIFSGFITLTLCSRRQYVFVNESKTWTEAQSYCRDKYADLATTENEQETIQLLNTVNDFNSIDLAWIGLYDDLNSWKWTLEDTGFLNVDEKLFRNWYSPEPQNYGGNTCVAMRNGVWEPINCLNYFTSVCYDGRENAEATYVFFPFYTTWKDAQRYCREHHTDLVSIRNENENQKVQYLLKKYNSDYAWIGLHGSRSWSDQNSSSFTFWKTGEPNGFASCIAVSFSDSGNWADENCYYEFPFFCYNDVASSRQYHFISESKIWTEAQRYCREKYTDLATIDNMDEMNRLMNTVNGSYSGSAWIGLYDDVNSWRWSLENNDFYQEGEKEFRSWYHEPNNYGGNELCVYMDYYGRWFDISCDYSHPFACYDGSASATESYIRISEGKSWTDARRYCREHYTDLANVRNMTENQKILGRIGGGVWIGLYRNRIWSDNQTYSYLNWRPQTFDFQRQPDNGYNIFGKWGYERCIAVSLRYSGRWTDETCLTNMPFFCYSRTCTQSSCSPPQYHFISESKNWTEAQRYCRENYTDLATIDNMDEMNRLIKTVEGIYYGTAWIGLYDDMNNWRWSLGNTELGGFKSWNVEQPRNQNGQSMCMYLSYSMGFWSELICSYQLSFVCYDGRQNASASYVFVSDYKTWTEAQSYCREHHTDLVSIRNDIENFRVLSLPYVSYVWIGLYRTRSWSDESNSTFSNWMSGQPNNARGIEYCTAVSFTDSGEWTDENCDYSLPFLCYSDLATPRQYHFISESKNWTEAQRYCRENFIDLATIDNMDEMNSLMDTVNGSYNGSAWIGLYDDLNSWRWSLENNDFYQEGEKDFRNWFHEPNNYVGDELCVLLGIDGNWADRSCDNYYPFVCYEGFESASQNYVLVYEGRTWSEAQRYCRKFYTDLASVRSETERQLILNILPGDAWIGLYRNRLWSDQSNSSFTYWLPYTSYAYAQPDNGLNVQGLSGGQHCTAVSLQSYGQWTDESCFDSLPFFCYSGKITSFYVMRSNKQYI